MFFIGVAPHLESTIEVLSSIFIDVASWRDSNLRAYLLVGKAH